MNIIWSPEEEKEFEEALKDAKGSALKTRCRDIAPWHGRSADAIFAKACSLGLKDKIDFNDRSVTDDEAAVLKVVREKKITSAGEISREVNRSKEYVKEIIAQLQERGYDVEYDDDTRQVKLEPHEHCQLDPLKLSILKGETLKFGLLSDMHLGSKFQCLSILRTAYEVFAKEDCYFAINAGDIVDGINMYKGQTAELFAHGADEQLDYAVENYPRAAFKTYLVAGNHDLSFKKTAGLNICRSIARLRDDIVYRGDCATDFIFKDRYRFHIIHPDGGGSYARSYKPQKIVEAIINEAVAEARNYFSEVAMEQIPVASGIGHYHTAGWFPLAGLNAFMLPCLQRQTDYMKRKALSPDIGFFIVTVRFDKKERACKIIPEYYPMGHYVRERDW